MVFGHSYVTTAVSHTRVVLSKFRSVLKAIREFPKRKNLLEHFFVSVNMLWHFVNVPDIFHEFY
jgi:hypothetical protein